jgi:Lrp/AsnC family leucine-responsive transcriptional regulator
MDDGDRAHLAVGPVREDAVRLRGGVKRCPNILSCHLMSGEYDYILRIAAKDLADYERIHKEWLSAMPHVTKINSSFALREIG